MGCVVPDQGRVRAAEPGDGHLGGVCDLAGVRECLPGQRLASAWREIRQQAACWFSRQAPFGMKTWRMRGWSSSQARVLLLSWPEGLSVIT